MQANVDQAELDKFEGLAARWWDPEGDSAALHHLNPVRLAYITRRLDLAGKRVLDVGCGGGLLSEAMAALGAEVTAVDMAEKPLKVARLHALESGLKIDYRCTSAAELAREQSGSFAAVTCMELLEHVPRPAQLVATCAQLLQPGGDCFFSTLNRTATAFVLGIVAAEHLLRLLPRGTHQYGRFVKPSELAAWARAAGLEVLHLQGMRYNPFSRRATLSSDLSINYLVHCRRGAR